ncbi:YDG/SRA domain-containing protein [Promicromonospora sukumoe]
MAKPSEFGEIPGFPPGSTFASREDLRKAGLHRHGQAGISGRWRDGADAIVVSGGYVDDLDEGDRLVYTGQGGQVGGRQVKDQELIRGNLALAVAEENGLPVRVIRGADGDPAHSPKHGLRYDGLYVVTQHWQEPSVDGPLIWRYVLEKSDGGEKWDEPAAPPPTGEAEPPRAASVVQRVIRNSAVTQWVKEQHAYACQFCGIVLETEAGPYAEGAHVRALGAPHHGPDVVSNVLCLCPNDHVLFDKGALYVDDGSVYRTSTAELVGELRTQSDHHITPEHFAYHREKFAGLNPG